MWEIPRPVLNDVEIARAIEEGLISVKDKTRYRGETAKNFIQPGSLDLILSNIEPPTPTYMEIQLEMRGKQHVPAPYETHHPHLNDSFVTFFPQTLTETYDDNVTWFDARVFHEVNVELRSTVRRLGLELEHQTMYFGDDFATFMVRNPRSYPISIEKGTKISQAIWKQLVREDISGMVSDDYSLEPIGSGRVVTSDEELESLFKSGDIHLGKDASYARGLVYFHAGTKATRNPQQHVVLRANKETYCLDTHGKRIDFSTTVKNEAKHIIQKGEFVDIQTVETIALSDRVGIQVFHAHNDIGPVPINGGLDEQNWQMKWSTGGGWVDPNYKGIFSVQPKNYHDNLIINAGDVIAVGRVVFWKEGVKLGYGSQRGSHYQGAKEFIGTQTTEQSYGTK